MGSIKIELNGQEKEIEPDTTISQLLDGLKIKSGTVVVEHNLNILKRAEHDCIILNDGDAVEIIHFVGGG